MGCRDVREGSTVAPGCRMCKERVGAGFTVSDFGFLSSTRPWMPGRVWTFLGGRVHGLARAGLDVLGLELRL